MSKTHHYALNLRWTGNTGKGTADYRSYERSHVLHAVGKPEILASSDPAFRGDRQRYNPEELLVASLSSCHMLWFLHLCADAGIIVTDYQDAPEGTMEETPDGGGRFIEIILRPVVTISDTSRRNELLHLHEKAHKFCFIANSVNFPVRCEPG